MKSKSEVISGEIQFKLEEFLGVIQDREFPNVFQDNDGANFAFRVMVLDNIYQISVQFAQVDSGSFVVYITGCFMSDDVEKNGVKIMGTPLGRTVTKDFAIEGVDVIEELYNTIYSLIIEHNPDFVRQLLD